MQDLRAFTFQVASAVLSSCCSSVQVVLHRNSRAEKHTQLDAIVAWQNMEREFFDNYVDVDTLAGLPPSHWSIPREVLEQVGVCTQGLRV